MKYFFVAGEASGDLHTSRVMNALKRLDPSAQFAYMGGSKMREEGGNSVVISEHLAFMGFLDVMKNISKIDKAGKQVQRALLSFNPDVVICTDYASFCFRYVLPFVRKNLPHTRIAYFIPPKVWAWKKGRIHQLKRDTDLILSIFPFELDFFKQNGIEHITYVGNPTKEEVDEHLDKHKCINKPPYIALLPGSRTSEVHQNLPTMLNVAQHFSNFKIKIAGKRSIPIEIYEQYLSKDIELVWEDSFSVIHGARVALVTSGTATLETALLGTPQVVCYAHRLKRLGNFIFNKLFSVPYISLVNLIGGREIVKELYAGLFTEENILRAMAPLTQESPQRQAMMQSYQDIRKLLETQELSSVRSAECLLNLAQSKTPNDQ